MSQNVKLEVQFNGLEIAKNEEELVSTLSRIIKANLLGGTPEVRRHRCPPNGALAAVNLAKAAQEIGQKAKDKEAERVSTRDLIDMAKVLTDYLNGQPDRDASPYKTDIHGDTIRDQIEAFGQILSDRANPPKEDMPQESDA